MSGPYDSEFHTVRGYQLLNRQDGQLTSAMEDYLEMIYRLCIQDGYTRINRLSEKLHVKPSSASKMILKLSQLGYLKYERYEIILLTERGRDTGSTLLSRHNTVENFLKLIGLDNTLEETELIEHSLSPETIARLNTLLDFFSRDAAVKKSYFDFRKSVQK